jgi:hypothetical protein
MRQLNGVFTQLSNRRHRRAGHVFEGRYKAILVDAETHLVELSRYVVLNPIRAGMVAAPEEWPWSSYLATIGAVDAPDWLTIDATLARFGARRTEAIRRWRRFVAEGIGADPIWRHLANRTILGDERFVARIQAKQQRVGQEASAARRARRAPAPPLESFVKRPTDRDASMAAAHATGAYSYQQIAERFGVHFTTVGRAVRAAKARERRSKRAG